MMGCLGDWLQMLWRHRKIHRLSLLFASIACIAFLVALFHRKVPPATHFEQASTTNTSQLSTITDDVARKCDSHDRPVLRMVRLTSSGPPPENAIHFLVADGTGKTKLLEICSIESAAALHPETPVVVTMTSSQLEWTAELEQLASDHPNVQFQQLDLKDRLSDTPFGGAWLDQAGIRGHQYEPVYISDVFRWTTLYKYGGIYLDSDMLLLKPITGFRNAISLEGDGAFANNNFLGFDQGHLLLLHVMSYLSKNFRTDAHSINGPAAVTKTLVERGWCKVDGFRRLKKCLYGVNLLPAETFNAIRWQLAADLLTSKRPGDVEAVREALAEAHSLHLYNHVTKDACIDLRPGRMQPAAAEHVRKSCPKLAEYVVSKGGKL